MCEDVGIALVEVSVGERPMVQGGPCVVVVNECDAARWPHADDACWPALAVAQPPVLPAADCLLENALGGEVKGSGGATSVVAPVDGALPAGETSSR